MQEERPHIYAWHLRFGRFKCERKTHLTVWWRGWHRNQHMSSVICWMVVVVFLLAILESSRVVQACERTCFYVYNARTDEGERKRGNEQEKSKAVHTTVTSIIGDNIKFITFKNNWKQIERTWVRILWFGELKTVKNSGAKAMHSEELATKMNNKWAINWVRYCTLLFMNKKSSTAL